MIIFPNAKINLGLNVLNRRVDGYHNIETILYPVEIKDALEIVEADQFVFSNSGIPFSGNPEENLCVKAWHLISRDFNLPPVHIYLHKQIPVGAGLGGGSADAAFCIRLLDDKFQLGLGVSQMEDYARQLGSDCAFFIRNRPAIASGKGDELKEIELNLEHYYLVLVMPAVHVNTAEAYQGVQLGANKGSLSDLPGLQVEEWRHTIKNNFEESIFKKHPIIKKVKEELYESGAIYASMSGSGASVYGIFKNKISLPGLEQDNLVHYGI
jgi:4-diphosphocytidyl-2-C-methyl-D-erythritol kinase